MAERCKEDIADHPVSSQSPQAFLIENVMTSGWVPFRICFPSHMSKPFRGTQKMRSLSTGTVLADHETQDDSVFHSRNSEARSDWDNVVSAYIQIRISAWRPC